MRGRSALARLNLVAVLCALPLVAALGRVAWLQGIRGQDYRRQADSQQMMRVYLAPERGSILDRNNEPLAYTAANYSIVADPALVKNPAHTARVLGRALDLPAARIERQLRSHRREVYLERRVIPPIEDRVDLNTLPGVSEKTEQKRIYPQGEFASQVVGYVNADDRGVGGIEGEYEELLRGDPGWATELRDGHGNTYPALGKQTKPSVSGHNVVLTLDSSLQDVAASALYKQAQALDARGAALVVVAVRTGEILAMVSYPSFNPEQVGISTADERRNRAVVDPYEPGSTFKVVAASAALTDHLLEPTTPINCENGRYNFGGYTITDHHPYATVTFKHAFAVSSNIAFGKVGRLCGDRLYGMARALGFGSPTGIGLPAEASGRVPKPSGWSGRTATTLAIGYETMVTPLQLAMAYAAVANDGVLMRPQLVKAITDASGRLVYRSRPEPVRRVMEPSVARTLRTFMREVMTDGTGQDADLDWIDVGGKTGTSEKLENGRYTAAKHYASFVGVAPIEDPKIVCLVMMDEPKGSTFGGSAAAPVFKEMLESWGRLPGAWLKPDYDVVRVYDPPTPAKDGNLLTPAASYASAGLHSPPPPPSPDGGLPELRGLALRVALQTLRGYGVRAVVRGSGTVVEQTPPPGSAVDGPVTLECSRTGTRALVASPASKFGRSESEAVPASTAGGR